MTVKPLTIKDCEHLFWLAAQDVVFFGTYDEGAEDWDAGWHPAVNCNDTFYYASADACSFDPHEAKGIRSAFERWGWAGAVAWCALKRNEEPLPHLRTDQYLEALSALRGEVLGETCIDGSRAQGGEAVSECKCDFRARMVGDGCDVCNPAQALEYAKETTAAQGAESERLRAELARVTAQRDAILMQARIWSGEAKAQKATVDAVGEILGGVPDWGPIAQGVEQLRAELAASREREARMRAVLQEMVDMINSGDEHGEGSPWHVDAVAALAEGAQG